MKAILQLLLSPFALLLGLGVNLRLWFYKKGILKAVKFDIPLIVVGNLNVGGTGKSPHIEFLVRFLNDYLEVATLSRGYKRKTEGFRYVAVENTAEEVGDEPLQFKWKFPDVVVAVGENRMYSVPQIVFDFPQTQTILLDDAFQHLQVKAGLNILLTEYYRPYFKDFLLPMGRLREWRSGAKRADIIIVTKCPEILNEGQRLEWLEALKPLPHQRVYFSKFQYKKPYYLFNKVLTYGLHDDNLEVLVICGIAKTDYLEQYLMQKVTKATLLRFPDHHFFSKSELGNLKERFEKINSREKIILTTEKDAVRLTEHRAFLIQHRLPIYVLPIEVTFLFEEEEGFKQDIQRFLLNFKV